MTILQAAGVRKFYGAFCALDGVSLIIGQGEHVSIIGRTAPARPRWSTCSPAWCRRAPARCHSRDTTSAGLDPVRLSRLGMARSFQLVSIFPQLSVGETIAVAAISSLGMGGRAFGPLRRNRGVVGDRSSVAGLFGFSSKLEQRAKSLSQGDKKLLDVASAFALNPRSSCWTSRPAVSAPRTSPRIMASLVRAAKETGVKAIIQVEHDMDIVFGYSSRIIAVHDRRSSCRRQTREMIRARGDVVATDRREAVTPCWK